MLLRPAGRTGLVGPQFLAVFAQHKFDEVERDLTGFLLRVRRARPAARTAKKADRIDADARAADGRNELHAFGAIRRAGGLGLESAEEIDRHADGCVADADVNRHLAAAVREITAVGANSLDDA